MTDSITVPGRVEPLLRAKLAAEAGGRIVEIVAGKGDRVEANQALLKIDSRLADAFLRQAEIQAADAEREMARWTELKPAGAVSASDFDRIKKAKELAAVALDEARVRVNQCEVRSPIAGVINDRTCEVGEYVNAGTVVFDVVNMDTVKVAFSIPEREIRYVEPNAALAFEIEAIAGRTFTGRVSFVAAAATRESNTFPAELQTANPGHLLRPGMVARVSLARRESKQALVVPLSAIVPQKGDYVVYVVEQGRAARRLIKISAILGSEAAVTDGLREGDQVVVEGGRALVDGGAVRVADETASPANNGSTPR
jgi:RND family efflux transporter MFP subunit